MPKIVQLLLDILNMPSRCLTNVLLADMNKKTDPIPHYSHKRNQISNSNCCLIIKLLSRQREQFLFSFEHLNGRFTCCDLQGHLITNGQNGRHGNEIEHLKFYDLESNTSQIEKWEMDKQQTSNRMPPTRRSESK